MAQIVSIVFFSGDTTCETKCQIKRLSLDKKKHIRRFLHITTFVKVLSPVSTGTL